ncbi:MAG TPA: FG-GAP-like repeat-containing protein [Terriglobia bacterium]|nr:FG-GAP-like repeat-containing protein [Terriglobia bacterium]
MRRVVLGIGTGLVVGALAAVVVLWQPAATMALTGAAAGAKMGPQTGARAAGNEGAIRGRNTGNNPVPLINQPLSPDVAAPGSAAFTLTVNGSGFVPGSVVNWNGSARTTTFVSSLKVTASILASDIAAMGTASVTVVNPAPGGGASNVCFFATTASESSVTLNRTDIGVGHDPAFMAVGDFNRDGKLDLAVTNDTDNTVSVLLGKGDGTFNAPTTVAVGVDPLGIVVADFNNDGKPDLAVVNDNCGAPPCQPGSVSILLGNGDGTFQTHVDFTVGTGPVHLAAGDFNGDGNIDLAVTNEIDDTVSILLGNGAGGFSTAVAYQCALGPISVGAGDFNQDGKLDLAVAGLVDSRVSILLGNGDGTFQSPEYLATGPEPFGLVVADFDNDGILDIAVTDIGVNDVAVLIGLGNANFFPAAIYPVTGGPFGLIAGDFNGDGILDLATASHSAPGASILLGSGGGKFQAATTYTTGANPVSVAAGDFNGDGRLDLVAADESAAAVSVLLQPVLAPAVTLSPTSLSYPDQGLGIPSPPQVVTLTNSGTTALSITSIGITGTNSGDYSQTNTCPISPSTLGAGANCTISVVFTPTMKNTRTASVSITDNAPGSPQTVSLSGIGTQVTLTPPSINFGNQTTGTSSNPVPVTVTNVSKNATVTITSITVSGTNMSSFSETNNCPISPSTLAAGATCTINVVFTPQSTGAKSAMVNVNDNGGGSPQIVPLSGTGT